MVDEVYANQRGWIAEKLSSTSKIPDGAFSSKNGVRMSGYGEQYMIAAMPHRMALAADGTYFVTTNPTIGTGVAHALNTSHDATKGLFAIYNSNPVGGKSVYLDNMRLILTGTAPATCTGQDFLVVTDQTSMLPTANSVTRTPVNVNSGDSTQPGAVVYAFNAGTLTIPTAGATRRNVSRIKIATGQVISGDEFVVEFGYAGMPGGHGGATAVRATDTGRRVSHAPPVVIAPGHWAVIYRWFTTETTNAPNFEYELAHFER